MVPPQVIERLSAAGVRLAVLFGSRATGAAGAGSDWDVGVVSAGDDLDTLEAALERELQGRVDLVDLRRAPPLLCMEVVRHGKVLLDVTGSEWALFCSLSLRRYEDTRKLRVAQQRSLETFLAARGLK